jgi:hypothetical protein
MPQANQHCSNLLTFNTQACQIKLFAKNDGEFLMVRIPFPSAGIDTLLKTTG